MKLPLQNFRKNVHKSLIHMEAASPKMRNRHFGVELGGAINLSHALLVHHIKAWGAALDVREHCFFQYERLRKVSNPHG
ncbi:MAG: hypothetical protein WAQ08_19300, partial [Aquabacterium sp.]|uniref:hypothetical protein n=1 Tax=Aquabacterium sp. TaxID=1872578 RepID=UPI003BAED472